MNSVPEPSSCVAESAQMIARAQAFAIQAHGNQRYGAEPYRVHLGAVVQVLRDFGEFSPDVLAAGWLHDTMEDTKTSWIDVAGAFNVRVADLVWAVTGTGETRKDRNRMIYAKVAKNPEAAIGKLADRIANVEYSDPSSAWFRMYFNERKGFGRAIYPHVPEAMRERLERAYERRAVA